MLDSSFTVLVCGGRNYADASRVNRFLDRIHQCRPIGLIATGACYFGGADLIAETWAKNREVPYIGIPARFRTGKHGRAEGPRRNERMLGQIQPDLVIGFPGGSGTADMLKRAEKRGVWTVDVQHNPRIDVERLRAIGDE